ncbi:unnamed protein product [Phytomonas sp. Hart1]|nr:unnamed protein product [Phytomonas sp. Hart1]|eukprot:CCW69913.1 unnamed protein product [Phytomonas sp. isolate Hart1]
MTLPPVELNEGGMTRRHYLVERNRIRRERYAPVLRALEEEDRRSALAREAERALWGKPTPPKQTTQAERPLPGGGPRSARMRATEGQRGVNIYLREREEAAQKKAAYNRLYNADMKEQLALREATLGKMKADEAQQMTALRELNEEADRLASEEALRAIEADKACMRRMREVNLSELEKRRQAAAEREKQDLELMRMVDQNLSHRDKVDAWQTKNFTLALKIQNENAHRESMKWANRTKSLNEKEMAAIMERDKRLLKEEQDANEAKKRLFRKEFDESVARDQEYRLKHNYDEPKSVTRQRNELAAESFKLIQYETRHKLMENKKQYRNDLMQQIDEKQKYQITHLDEV